LYYTQQDANPENKKENLVYTTGKSSELFSKALAILLLISDFDTNLLYSDGT
jgi:hypothetical protein